MSELRKRKVDVEVVRGVDLDSELALALVKKHQRAALYALCRDSDLDDYGVDYLKGVLLASGFVDEHNVVVVMPRASALAAEASALTTMARLVRRGTLAKRKVAAPPRPPATQGLARPTAAKAKFAPMGSPAKAAPAKAAPVKAAPVKAAPVKAASQTPAETQPMRGGGARKSSPPVPKREPSLSDKHPVLPAASSAGALVDIDEMEAFAMSRKKQGVMAFLGGAGLFAVAIFFAPYGGVDETVTTVTTSADGELSPEEIVAAAQAKITREAEAKASEAEEQKTAAAETKEEENAAYRAERAAAAGVEPAPESTEAQNAEAQDEIIEDTEVVDGEISQAAERHAIEVALASRKLRALDMLLIDPRRSRRGNFAKAKAHCTDRDAYGVGGWRLPTVGEATVLVSTGIVGKEKYWTGTDADTWGTRQIMYDAKRRRIKSYSPRYSGARAVCVRVRARVGEESLGFGRGSAPKKIPGSPDR